MTTPPFGIDSGGVHGPAWPAFYRQGLWNPLAGANGFALVEDVNNGDTEIRVNQIPNGAGAVVPFTNMWEANVPAGEVGSGYAKLLRLDPPGADHQVLCRALNPFLTDAVAGNVIIYLAKPVEGLAAPIVATKTIGMGHSPLFNVSSGTRKVTLIAQTHAFDDRATARSNGPDIAIKLFMADNPAGPFVEIGPLPAGVTFSAVTGGVDNVSVAAFEFLPMAYAKFVAEDSGSDNNNSLFSFFISRGSRQ